MDPLSSSSITPLRWRISVSVTGLVSVTASLALNWVVNAEHANFFLGRFYRSFQGFRLGDDFCAVGVVVALSSLSNAANLPGMTPSAMVNFLKMVIAGTDIMGPCAEGWSIAPWWLR